MQKVQIFVVLALLVSVAFFLVVTRARRQREDHESLHVFRSGQGPTAPQPFTLKSFSAKLAELESAGAQWDLILSTLNPTGNPDVAHLLMQIRGPHMFDPRTALGVLSDGCRAVPPGSTYIAAIQAAVESMNKVVRYGD